MPDDTENGSDTAAGSRADDTDAQQAAIAHDECLVTLRFSGLAV